SCSVKNEAPCYINGGEVPAPTPEPVVDPTFGPVMTSSAPSSAPTSAAPTADGDFCALAGGIPGIESSDGQACCLASCGQCGGVGCSSAGAASDCCVTDIVELGESCSVKNEAPCYIDGGDVPAPTPGAPTPTPVAHPAASGPDLDNDGNVDRWEYVGCYENLSGDVVDFDAIESDDLLTPITCFETCGAENALYFVVSRGDKCACGFDPTFLEQPKVADACYEPCSGDEAYSCGGEEEYELYELFDDEPMTATPAPGVVPAPTSHPVMPTPEPVLAPTPDPLTVTASPTAPAPTSAGDVCPLAGGIPGIESSDGQACCAASCGQCGGVGCSSVGAARDCCVTDIVELGEACSVTYEAPCYIGEGGQATSAPTSSPGTPTPSGSGGSMDSADVDIDGDGNADSFGA
ncbi:unnamed protein product, partial [Scytosiphon promiscuus]